eukprot:jgi/Bigna1/75691/fgenesh1_pg.36_\
MASSLAGWLNERCFADETRGDVKFSESLLVSILRVAYGVLPNSEDAGDQSSIGTEKVMAILAKHLLTQHSTSAVDVPDRASSPKTTKDFASVLSVRKFLSIFKTIISIRIQVCKRLLKAYRAMHVIKDFTGFLAEEGRQIVEGARVLRPLEDVKDALSICRKPTKTSSGTGILQSSSAATTSYDSDKTLMRRIGKISTMWWQLSFQHLVYKLVLNDEICVKYPPCPKYRYLFISSFQAAISDAMKGCELHTIMTQIRRELAASSIAKAPYRTFDVRHTACIHSADGRAERGRNGDDDEEDIKGKNLSKTKRGDSKKRAFTGKERIVPITVQTTANLSSLMRREGPYFTPLPFSASSQSNVSCWVWPGAIILADYILSHPEIVSGKRVLELGSGTGILACVLVRMLHDAPPSALLVTDNDDYSLERIETNLAININDKGGKNRRGGDGEEGGGEDEEDGRRSNSTKTKKDREEHRIEAKENPRRSCNRNRIANKIEASSALDKVHKSYCQNATSYKTSFLDWENFDVNMLKAYGADVVLGSDLIYSPRAFDPLLEVIEACLLVANPASMVILVCMVRDLDTFAAFERKLSLRQRIKASRLSLPDVSHFDIEFTGGLNTSWFKTPSKAKIMKIVAASTQQDISCTE